MKRRTRIILSCIGLTVCVGIFGYFTREFWHDQWLAYLLGRVELEAWRFQHLPGDIDTVEIYTFGDDSKGDDTQGFMGDGEGPLKTIEHRTLTGKDAKEVVELWGEFAVGREFQALCFAPVYGLQFKQNGKIFFQTAVCWHCSGYTIPVPPFGTVQYGFDSKSEGAQKLLQTLERHLPLPPEPKEKDSAK